jgi:hypothetical protein
MGGGQREVLAYADRELNFITDAAGLAPVV